MLLRFRIIGRSGIAKSIKKFRYMWVIDSFLKVISEFLFLCFLNSSKLNVLITLQLIDCNCSDNHEVIFPKFVHSDNSLNEFLYVYFIKKWLFFLNTGANIFFQEMNIFLSEFSLSTVKCTCIFSLLCLFVFQHQQNIISEMHVMYICSFHLDKLIYDSITHIPII